MVDPELKQSPTAERQSNPVENMETLFSPRLKSLAAMAGWDEESILVASLIVEDTPDREFKHKKRFDFNLKTPPSNSSRRNQRKSPISISIPVINLDEEKSQRQEKQKEKKIEVVEECKRDEDESSKEDSGVSCSKSAVPRMDKLKEELSCAICLEICFEPSTTSCGHSFCKKCLRSAADKCGRKCPKCRQLISNGRSCTVNTVLWNTIQLLFPEEVEARKASREEMSPRTRQMLERRQAPRRKRPATLEDLGIEYSRRGQDETDSRTLQGVEELSRLLNGDEIGRNRRGTSRQNEQVERNMQRQNLSWVLERGRRRGGGRPSQDEDAALALRLQREEFLGSSSLSLARANLRAMASRANYNVRNRTRPSFS
ncbi:uncharacterized protein [Euphorbia lathyris]|uniref:uncharacterized protein isoform X2 n=1 Tax=Euphorbia lathyris TaxID=212925 RepID=UPI00331411A5